MIENEELKKLEDKYLKFIKTEDGEKWKASCINTMGSDIAGDFGDFLYDFYPEYLS